MIVFSMMLIASFFLLWILGVTITNFVFLWTYWLPAVDMSWVVILLAIFCSLAFSKLLLERANVAVSPGIGFGEYGEGFVRIALVENRQRLRQATRNIRAFLSGRNDVVELRRIEHNMSAAES